MPNNIWSAWLEETPDILYRAMIPGGRSQNFLDYWKSNYNKVYGDYLGSLGSMALRGLDPNGSFYDYLNTLNWQGDWSKLLPSQRGEMRPFTSFWNIPSRQY